MSFEKITQLLAKGQAITRADVQEIEAQLALMPPGEARAIAPTVWEGLALIVNDLEYEGDAKLPGESD